MTTTPEHSAETREIERQTQALAPPHAGESEAIATYRKIYAGVRWAPMPVIDPGFAARVMQRCGIVENEQAAIERKLVPTLFTAFGISGSVAAGPQLLGALTQLAMDLSNLPWLQFGAAISAIAAAAAVDRLLGQRRRRVART